jgi:succinylglutamate desuccinylase
VVEMGNTFLRRLKQRYCKHEMNRMWGLCVKCGYEDPTWTPQRVMKDVQSSMESKYALYRGVGRRVG